jgi:hypothetical protein
MLLFSLDEKGGIGLYVGTVPVFAWGEMKKIQCPDIDSNRLHPEYKSDAFTD